MGGGDIDGRYATGHSRVTSWITLAILPVGCHGRRQIPARLDVTGFGDERAEVTPRYLRSEDAVSGCWPAYSLLNEDPLPDGEVDVVEWYGNGAWPPGTTVHARSDGKTWSGKSIPELVDSEWHNWRCRWDEAGFRFWRDYVDGAKPYLTVPAVPIKGVWPFNQPDYLMFPIFNLAVGRPGAGDPSGGTFPAVMLVDWIRVR